MKGRRWTVILLLVPAFGFMALRAGASPSAPARLAARMAQNLHVGCSPRVTLDAHLPHGWAGMADAGSCEVWLAPDVLRAALAHEVAHLATPNHGHDGTWYGTYLVLCEDFQIDAALTQASS